MDDTSDQDNELEIISETVKPQSNYDHTSKLLNQAAKRKLMQKYPRLKLAGKEIRVVPSRSGGVIDPSRMKIVNITRIPLKPVQVPNVRYFPGITKNNASTSSNKENTPPGGSNKVQVRNSLRASSNQSLFSLSSDEEERSPLSPEPRTDPQRLSYSSTLDFLSLSSDEEDDGTPERTSCDSLGFANNNNSQSIPEDRPEKEAIRFTKDNEPDPCLDNFHPLDTIKARLIEEKMSSEVFLKSCRDLKNNWIRLDKNWNVEISSSALRTAFGADLIDLIINPPPEPVHRQSDIYDDLPCVGDEGHGDRIGNNQQTEEDTSDVILGNFGDPGDEVSAVVDMGTQSTDALLDWGNEAGDQDEQVSDGDTQDGDENVQSVSPPSLYHRPREEMVTILGLVTHEQARITR